MTLTIEDLRDQYVDLLRIYIKARNKGPSTKGKIITLEAARNHLEIWVRWYEEDRHRWKVVDGLDAMVLRVALAARIYHEALERGLDAAILWRLTAV